MHLFLENHADSVKLALFLHTLVVFTSPKSWGILKVKQFDKMQVTMHKVCCNILGNVVQNGFYKIMRVCISLHL